MTAYWRVRACDSYPSPGWGGEQTICSGYGVEGDKISPAAAWSMTTGVTAQPTLHPRNTLLLCTTSVQIHSKTLSCFGISGCHKRWPSTYRCLLPALETAASFYSGSAVPPVGTRAFVLQATALTTHGSSSLK